MLKRWFIMISMFCIIGILFTSSYEIPMKIEVTSTNRLFATNTVTLVEKQPLPETVITEITISSIGDVLLHRPVYLDAWTGATYHFTPMLERVKPYLQAATITAANQESMIGGTSIGLSSYPTFNSPQQIGDTLKEVGVDIVMLANNHTLDRGERAIHLAIEHWKRLGTEYVGSYTSAEDKARIRVVETEAGISVAFLAYTYGTNGIPVPKGKEYLVNLIDEAAIASEVERAKEAADVVVLHLHFGNEYERMPNDRQKALVQFAADQGVDAVIGHHPHVLQPATWVEGAGGQQTLVIYSLGNFLSNQQDLYTRIGGIFTFTVKKMTRGEREKVELHSPTLLPTYVTFHPRWRDYEVVPLRDVTDADLPEAKRHYAEIKAHMSQWLPELEFVE